MALVATATQLRSNTVHGHVGKVPTPAHNHHAAQQHQHQLPRAHKSTPPTSTSPTTVMGPCDMESLDTQHRQVSLSPSSSSSSASSAVQRGDEWHSQPISHTSTSQQPCTDHCVSEGFALKCKMCGCWSKLPQSSNRRENDGSNTESAATHGSDNGTMQPKPRCVTFAATHTAYIVPRYVISQSMEDSASTHVDVNDTVAHPQHQRGNEASVPSSNNDSSVLAQPQQQTSVASSSSTDQQHTCPTTNTVSSTEQGNKVALQRTKTTRPSKTASKGKRGRRGLPINGFWWTSSEIAQHINFNRILVRHLDAVAHDEDKVRQALSLGIRSSKHQLMRARRIRHVRRAVLQEVKRQRTDHEESQRLSQEQFSQEQLQYTDEDGCLIAEGLFDDLFHDHHNMTFDDDDNGDDDGISEADPSSDPSLSDIYCDSPTLRSGQSSLSPASAAVSFEDVLPNNSVGHSTCDCCCHEIQASMVDGSPNEVIDTSAMEYNFDAIAEASRKYSYRLPVTKTVPSSTIPSPPCSQTEVRMLDSPSRKRQRPRTTNTTCNGNNDNGNKKLRHHSAPTMIDLTTQLPVSPINAPNARLISSSPSPSLTLPASAALEPPLTPSRSLLVTDPAPSFSLKRSSPTQR